MNKAFIFTMDAVLALIPVFIIMASISTISYGGSLFLQSHILGAERIAQDTLRVFELKGLIRSTNATELNETLSRAIPSHLNYNYTLTNITSGEVILSVARGDLTNATDIMQATRVVSVGVDPRYVVVTPTVMTKTFIDINDPRKDNQSKALDAVICALLGIPELNITDVIGPNYWYQMSQVRVNISDLESWTNRTIGYLLDRLYDEAVLEGNLDAEDGFDEIKSRVNSAGRGMLNYSWDHILDYDDTIPSVMNMEISALDILYTASQSANIKSGKAETASIYNSDQDRKLNITVDLIGNKSTRIVVRKKGDPSFSSERTTKTEIELYINTTEGWQLNETIRAFINPDPGFNVTNIRLDPTDASIVLVDIDSITGGKFKVWAGGSRIDASQEKITLYPNKFKGNPMAETGVIFQYNDTNTQFYFNYKNATINAGSELGAILNEFPLTKLEYNSTTGYVLAEREGYVTVSSVKFEIPQYKVTLKVWGA